MTITLEIPIGILGLSPLVDLYADGPDATALQSGLSATPGSNDTTDYFVTVTAIGLVKIVVRLGSAVLLRGWATLPTSGQATIRSNRDLGISVSDLLSDPSQKIQTFSDGVAIHAPNGGITVTLISALNNAGNRMLLIKGDDYSTTNGNPLIFQITNQSALIGSAAHLRFDGQVDDACISSTITMATQQVTMGDMLSAYTSMLPVTQTLAYQLRFINTTTGLTTTVLYGKANIIEGL